MQELFSLDDFNLGRIMGELSCIGATSIRLLNEGFRSSLLQEAEGYTYKPEDEAVGSGDRIVHQQLASFDNFSTEGNFILLKKSFQAFLDQCLEEAVPYPFDTRLNLNSMVLQKYESGSLGITPHRDGLRYINLVCIFIIGGRGRFCICSDRSGTDATEIAASPGNVILMKAPGFLGSNKRSFHFVTDIQETRYTCGLRQQAPMAIPRHTS